jgi:hypothetical protein
VGRKERLTEFVEIILIRLEHTVEPRKEFLGTVIRMQNDRDSVVFGNGTNVHGQSDGSSRGTIRVLATLSEHERASTIGHLDNDGGLGLASGFQTGVGSGRTVETREFIIQTRGFMDENSTCHKRFPTRVLLLIVLKV